MKPNPLLDPNSIDMLPNTKSDIDKQLRNEIEFFPKILMYLKGEVLIHYSLLKTPMKCLFHALYEQVKLVEKSESNARVKNELSSLLTF